MALSESSGINYFDNLELLQCKSSSHEFPLHYHNTDIPKLIVKGYFGVTSPKYSSRSHFNKNTSNQKGLQI